MDMVLESEKKPRQWIVGVAIFMLLLFLFVIGIVPRIVNREKIEALAEQENLPQVTVVSLKPNRKADELVLPSSAQAWHITPIWARVNGYLIDYLVDIGDHVKVGDLLAVIDTPEVDQQLAQAQADLASSQANRDIAKITSQRWQQVWDKNREAVSKQEVDQYNANLESTEAIVVANEKNVARLAYQQQFKYIIAPFEGIITQRSVDIGSLILGNIDGANQQLFQIAQTHTIRFYVSVPQTYFRQIKEGIEAEVRVSEYPDKVFKGVVTRFAKALDPTARTLLTEVDVKNDEGLLYAGLFGKVTFKMIPETVNFIIPTTAMIIRAGYPHVAVVDESNTIQMKKVKIGLDYGKEIQIVEGLKENERIVILPSANIDNGMRVQIVTES